MPTQTRVLRPGPRPDTFLTERGDVLAPPPGWACLAPGDAGLTRRVKAGGPTWTVQEKVGRKVFSKGVWAPAERIETERARLDAERASPNYQKRLAQGRARRDSEQREYVEDFRGAVLSFLAFHPKNDALAAALADRVTAHATPVGSGTVARTERIPIEDRAEAAVIAWMRHQTTAYDDMAIARIKGERRRVRRMLAERSKIVLERYRRGGDADDGGCPLARALRER